ncbi:hypothetical protein CAOG_07180 [Capsaspora owczarzaki ATCC 30864]|uniref:hypothetical protein n=1 Tax=Capsaspora owczarzaki (strain ATCC 30864) TaxID=595528 RepID=UPI0003525D16|nr:hypothetical protein CAOG_07180 [Capsaspora owczarzaki ATCC 30864]|eukprot:XP_004343904.2 hypothetical protein CAOG_07180 [Capsaspora owczarzaki ATCC 30864]
MLRRAWFWFSHASHPIVQVLYVLLLTWAAFLAVPSLYTPAGVAPTISAKARSPNSAQLESGPPIVVLPAHLIPGNLAQAVHALVGICIVLFWRLSWSNPGRITPTNLAARLRSYPFDNYFYCSGVACLQCPPMPGAKAGLTDAGGHRLKPARSKHCRACNLCVHRFDHHCIWINNCVGGNNIGQFLLFLLANTGLCIAAAAHSAWSLSALVQHMNLWSMWIVDGSDNNNPVPIVWHGIVRFIFRENPSMTTMLAIASAMILFTAGMLIYHLYLIATNVTTWEHDRFPSRKENPAYLDRFPGRYSFYDGGGFGANFRDALVTNEYATPAILRKWR